MLHRLSVCGETTTYSTTMCDISLEREFNYLLYGISADWLTKTSTTDVRVTLPTNFRLVGGYPNIRGQEIKFVPIILLLRSHFLC